VLVDFVKVKLVKEARVQYVVNQITNPDSAVELFQDILEDEDRETMVALLLSAKNRPIAVNTIGTGILSQVSTHPREVFKAAILANAAVIILAHNHPSGDPAPSKEDINLTKRMIQAGEIIGINVLDHVIVGHDGDYVSLKASGLI